MFQNIVFLYIIGLAQFFTWMKCIPIQKACACPVGKNKVKGAGAIFIEICLEDEENVIDLKR
ncbi:hypothetical protein [Virgibacillus dokdonensis]|uniref:hypothetical protein n=1 Tax=Virgibacillus dokdonensis TaxID=302167 RepID=UPI001591E6AF|nr:hypothetical protein [Virgibacillus dokdonensis]